MTGRSATTGALGRLCDGDVDADDDLAALVYSDMRRLAGALMLGERAGHTLQATGLVHEAWLRLVDETAFQGERAADAKRKFLGHAVQAMRRILIEHARARAADKRGGGREHAPLSDSVAFAVEDVQELLDLDEAMHELADRKPRVARIAELRIFGGLSTAEAADAVGIGLTVAKAEWALAKARLTQRVCDR